MIYQGPDGARWLDFRGELQNISTAADLCTHATMCADKGVDSFEGIHEIELTTSLRFIYACCYLQCLEAYPSLQG